MNMKAKISNEQGNYSTELAMVIVMFMMFTVGSVCYAFNFSMWSLLNKAAHNGITVALTAPGVDSPIGSPEHATWVQEVITSVQTFPSLTGFFTIADLTVRVIRPGEPLHPTYDTVAWANDPTAPDFFSLLNTHPVVVQVDGNVPSGILYMGNSQITSTAVGFR